MAHYSYGLLARKGHSYLYDETGPKRIESTVETTVSLHNTELSPEGRATLVANRMLKGVPSGEQTQEEIIADWLRT